MGVFIRLSVVPHQIDAEDWAEVYDDTLQVLRAHPSRLMGSDYRDVLGAQVPMYTQELERDADDPAQRCWWVVGDFETLEVGETHDLYRNLDRYRRGSSGEASVDILFGHGPLAWDWTGEPLPPSGRMAAVLDGKTQGRGYHIPVLAAAMVVESCFPRRALVSGDITPEQARKAKRWAESVLKRPVELPVLLDPLRLIRRLDEHLDSRDRDEAFTRLCLDERESKRLEAFLSVMEPATQEEWLRSRLVEQEGPSTRASMRTFVVWLNATKDLERLCEIACLKGDGPGWSPSDLVEVLADVWIALPGDAPPPRTQFIRDGGFHGIKAALAGPARSSGEPHGRLLEVRFDDAGLDEMLRRVFGDDTPGLIERVKEVSKHLEAPVQTLREQMAAYLDRNSGPGSDTLEQLALVSSAEELGEVQRSAIREVVQTLDEGRGGEGRAGSTSGALRRRLAQLVAQRLYLATEDAWAWIRVEDDTEVLSLLLCLAEQTGRSLSFNQVRRALFEQRALCREAVAMRRRRSR